MSYDFRYKHVLPNGDIRVRRPVPPDLIAIIGSKSLTRNLDTKDDATAFQRQFAKNAEVQEIIDAAQREWESSRPVTRVVAFPQSIHIPNLDPAVKGQIESVLDREFPGLLKVRTGGFGVMGNRRITQRADAPWPDQNWYRAKREPVPSERLLAEWKKRRAPGKNSISFFESKFKAFIAWLATQGKPDDITVVEDTHVIDYVGYLIDRKPALSPTSIKNYLQALKTLFEFATEIKLGGIRDNPAAKVKYSAKKDKRKARRPFPLEDQIKILTAARSAKPLIKWTNWISGFSGARLSEIAMAHKRDVVEIEGVLCLHVREDLRDEDEGLKTEESWRTFPLHSAVLREGFREYVDALPDGPLFEDGSQASQINSRWLRGTVGVTDPLTPFHSWRHTFITASRVRIDERGTLRIPREVRIAITGHAEGEKSSVGDSYGDWPMATLKAHIERIPDPTVEAERAAA